MISTSPPLPCWPSRGFKKFIANSEAFVVGIQKENLLRVRGEEKFSPCVVARGLKHPFPIKMDMDTGSNGRGGIRLAAVGQVKLEVKDGIVIVDHGSRREQSNAMLHEFVKMYQEETEQQIVEAAHMELAEPTLSDAVDRCVEQGATRIIISPYFLFPGRHWDKDIPKLAADAVRKHPQVSYIVTAPIGLHKLMVGILQERMQYCLSQVAGDVSECDMCKDSGRCKEITPADSQAKSDTVGNTLLSLNLP